MQTSVREVKAEETPHYLVDIAGGPILRCVAVQLLTRRRKWSLLAQENAELVQASAVTWTRQHVQGPPDYTVDSDLWGATHLMH